MNYGIESTGSYELVVRKSRFLAQALFVSSSDETRRTLAELRSHYSDANHVCYAYRIEGEGNIEVRFSDDGEPKGTAGKPLLSVLEYEHIVNALLVVVRYFGGIKLGTGGLVRAYGDAGRGAVVNAGPAPIIQKRRCAFHVSYDLYDIVRAVNEKYGATPFDEEFSERVYMHIEIPESRYLAWKGRLQDVSRGRIIPRDMD